MENHFSNFLHLGFSIFFVSLFAFRARAHENLSKAQIGINKSEKSSTLYLKMRKAASNILMLNYPILDLHWVKNATHQKHFILQILRAPERSKWLSKRNCI